MLNGTLTLHGHDAEKLCRDRIGVRIRKGQTFPPQELEDCLAYLAAEAWRLAERYNPALDPRQDFARWAIPKLDLDIIDWSRKRYGETGSGRNARIKWPQQTTSLDSNDQLATPLTNRPSDPPTDRDPDLTRILTHRNRGDHRDHALIRAAAARLAA